MNKMKGRQECLPHVEQTLLSAHSESEPCVEQTLLSAHRRIHMLGIGGIGMAGLAFLLKERGHTVSGSDAQENRQTDWLRGKGITIRYDVPADADWIIRSRAVPDTHPDIVAAAVPVSWRGEVLPALLRDRFTIAVSGTHGKTTTTAMIAQILDCGYCIGGEVDGFDGVARDGEIMVVEADESDGTVANYHPDIAVITNIEYDHMEHHDSAEAFEACFLRFAENTKEKIIYCVEDPASVRLFKNNPKAVPYGENVSRRVNVTAFDAEPCSTAYPKGSGFSEIKVSLPGRHNQLNAMAALTVSKHWKNETEIFQALENLRSVKRRFEVVHQGEYTIISDYAHHPTEIRALIDTALETLKPKRLLGVFQPHRYTRTKALGEDFPPAFQGLEKLWLLPVYAASEEPIEGGTTADLLKKFPSIGKPEIKSFQTLEKTWQDISDELKEGDVLLIIGAGDVDKIGGMME